MPTPALISLADPSPDWLHTVHNPETTIGPHTVPFPFQLFEADIASGGEFAFHIDAPYAVAVGHVVAVAVQGQLSGLVAAPPPPLVTDWAIRTFLATEGLVGFDRMSLDGLARLADLPPPELTRCPRCRGRLREPGAEVSVGVHATRDDGVGCVSAPTCELCHGTGRIPQLEDGYVQMGPIKIDRRALTRIVPHLRGNEVAWCVAPSADGLIAGGMDVHVRPYVERANGEKCVGGEWRIVLSAVDRVPLVEVAS